MHVFSWSTSTPSQNCTLYWLNEADWKKHIKNSGTLLAFFNACLNDRQFDISSIIVTPTRFIKYPWYQKFDLRLNRGIKLIPSDMQLFGVDLRLAQRFGFENPKAQLFLRKALMSIESDYDFVFIDCPPNLYLATRNGLFASQYYVPVNTMLLSHCQSIFLH
jgi:chromosome partitioning protein